MWKSLLAITLALGTVALGQTGASGDEAIPRDIVMRLLGFPREVAAEEALFVGQLPEALPVALPIPEDADIVAAIMRGQDSVHVIVDVPRPVDQVEEFLAAALREPEWTQPPQQAWHYDIFIPADLGYPMPFYCHAASDYYLSVHLNTDLRSLTPVEADAELTEVRLDLTRGHDYSPCAQPEAVELYRPPEETFPELRLVAPPDSEQRGVEQSFSQTVRTAWVQIVGGMDAPTLRDHYTTQMQSQEWTVRESGQSEGVFWSNLTLQDAEGQAWWALLLVMAGADERQEHDVHLTLARR